jgi:hypothetical protein
MLTVDHGARLISGVAAPYGMVAKRAFRRWSFGPGCLALWHPVWLLRDHDWSQSVGLVVDVRETVEGLILTARVDETPRGDRSLAVAGRSGLSVNVEGYEVDHVDGVCLITQATVKEVSLVARPAFAARG